LAHGGNVVELGTGAAGTLRPPGSQSYNCVDPKTQDDFAALAVSPFKLSELCGTSTYAA
jgi:hypothetical protein